MDTQRPWSCGGQGRGPDPAALVDVSLMSRWSLDTKSAASKKGWGRAPGSPRSAHPCLLLCGAGWLWVGQSAAAKGPCSLSLRDSAADEAPLTCPLPLELAEPPHLVGPPESRAPRACEDAQGYRYERGWGACRQTFGDEAEEPSVNSAREPALRGDQEALSFPLRRGRQIFIFIKILLGRQGRELVAGRLYERGRRLLNGHVAGLACTPVPCSCCHNTPVHILTQTPPQRLS